MVYRGVINVRVLPQQNFSCNPMATPHIVLTRTRARGGAPPEAWYKKTWSAMYLVIEPRLYFKPRCDFQCSDLRHHTSSHGAVKPMPTIPTGESTTPKTSWWDTWEACFSAEKVPGK